MSKQAESALERAKRLMEPVVVHQPIGHVPPTTTKHPSSGMVELAQSHALIAVAEELRIQNLIACSDRVYIRDAPDKIREHFGEAALGQAFTSGPVTEEQLQGWIAEFLGERASVYHELDEDGDLGFDGMINIPKLARWLLLQMKAAR